MNKIFTLLLAFVLLGCGKTREKQLLGDFFIRYNQDNGDIKAQAKFKEYAGEASETWYYPSTGVSFMDLPMYLKKNAGITDDFYEYEGKKQLKEEMLFKFVNAKSQPIKQKITHRELSNFKIKEGAVTIDSGFTLVWEGSPLRGQDEFLLIAEFENAPQQRIAYSGATKANELRYIPQQLTGFKKGKARFSLMHMHYERFPEESEVQGAFTIEYYFTPFEVEIL
jgi:hypothetical protein